MDGFKQVQNSIHEIKAEEVKKNDTSFVPAINDHDRKKDGVDTRKKAPETGKIIIREPQQVVSLNKIAPMPKTSANKTNMTFKEIRKAYSDEEMNLRLKELSDAGYEIPKTGNELSRIRAKKMDPVKVIGDDGMEKTEFVWQDDVPQNIRQHYDWLREYFFYTNDTREEYRQVSNVKLPDVAHKVNVNGIDKIYEHQKGANCYCCSGTAMLNQFIKNGNKEKEPVRHFSQYDLRSYRPFVKKFDQRYEDQGIYNRGQYRQIAGEIDQYAGAGKEEYGNIFEMGDFFIEKTGGKAMLNKLYFQRPQKQGNALHNMLTVFKNKVNEVLAAGNVLGFLEVEGKYGHYVTITGINGDDITIQNSLKPEGKTQEVKKVDQLFNRLISTGNPVELVWLSDMKTPKELTKEYSNLSYDEEKGYSLIRPNEEGVADITHTKGLAVKKELDDMGPGMESITEVAYIPNPLSKPEIQSLDDALHANVQQKNVQHENVKHENIQHENARYRESIIDEKSRDYINMNEEEVQEEEITDFEESEDGQQYSEEELREKEEIKKRITSYYETKRQKRVSELKEKERESEAAGNKKAIKELEKLRLESKYDPKKKKKARKAAAKKVRDYEKKNKDYASFGVSFDIKSAVANDADSSLMRTVKDSLMNYMKIRRSIFDKYKLRDVGVGDLLDQVVRKEAFIVRNGSNVVKLSLDDRNLFGEAHDRLKAAADKYILERSGFFKFGRGNARLKQVRNLKKQLQLDNTRFYLSSERRMLINSVDEKYEKDNASLRQKMMPTWKKFIAVKDELNLRNKVYRIERQMQRENGTLPSITTRMGEWCYRALNNTWLRSKIVYNGIGGTIDRTIGAATMLAANTLELGGKVVKAPLKLLSMMFNGASSALGFRARWRMKYSLGEGWKGIDDGRKIFRRYLKGACLLPAFVTESLTRGIPYIFGHEFKSGVYKRTKRWGKNILEDIKNVGKSLGIKDYAAMDRGDMEYSEIPGHMEEDGELRKYNSDGRWDNGHTTFNDTTYLEDIFSESDSELEEEIEESKSDRQLREDNKKSEIPAEWTFAGSRVTASDFRTRKLFANKDKQKASPEQVLNMLGEDKLAQMAYANIKGLDEDFLGKKFRGKKPGANELKGFISDAYQQVKGKNLSDKEAGKRLDETNEKLMLRDHLREEMRKLSDHRLEEREAVKKVTYVDTANRSLNDYKTDEEKAALDLWAFGKEGDPDYFNINRFNDEMAHIDTYSGPLRSLMNIKIDEFIDKNEADAASGFAAKYEKICKMAAGDVIIDKYEEYARTRADGFIDLPVGMMRGKVAFFKELKIQYENRFKLMTSPCYALLKKDDIKKYLEKDGVKKANAIKDEVLRDFVLLYIRTMTSPLAIGKDLRKVYEAKINDAKTRQAGLDEGRSANLYTQLCEFNKHPVKTDDIPKLFTKVENTYLQAVASDQDVDRHLRSLYLAKKADVSDKLKKILGNPGFVDNYPPSYDTRVFGMELDEQHKLEKFLVWDIFAEGKINGKEVSKEQQDRIGKAVDECMSVRREFIAVSETVKYIEFLCNGAGCDLKNESFTGKNTGKMLLKYYSEDGIPDGYATVKLIKSQEYATALNNVLMLIHDMGFTLSEKYEERILTDGDKALEAERKKYEDRLNEERKEGEEEKNWDYPGVTVNGRQFRLYFLEAEKDHPLNKLKGGDFTVEDGEKDQLYNELEQLSEALKTRMVVRSLYSGEVGMKSVIFSVYSKSCDIKCENLLKEISKKLKL